MLDHYLKLILKAPVYEVATETNLEFAEALTKKFSNNIWLKREDTQPSFSYKIRGAYSLITSLMAEKKVNGLVAASAGNHAQGVGLAAKKLGLAAIIIMPKTTPEIKIKAVKAFGAHVQLHGNTYDEASSLAKIIAKEKSFELIPPYDNQYIIAGQGTVGMEILRQHKGDIDFIFLPVGGGGLIAGVAAYIKQINPHIKIIGVEPEEAPSMTAALAAKKPVALEHVGIFADGAAVKKVGQKNYDIVEKYVDEILLVSVDEICAGIKDIFEEKRVVLEPAGALSIAGAKQFLLERKLHSKNIVCVCSGANINFDRLRHVAELADLGEKREVLLGVTIPERPGSFKEFCTAIGPRSITEFNYRVSSQISAEVFVGIRVQEAEKEKKLLFKRLVSKGYKAIDLSENELAKTHIRFMVGGRYTKENERLYRFEFPERPGALLKFLTRLGDDWNISLFHYRNHGAPYGRVLAGIEIRPDQIEEFTSALRELKITYFDETENDAYNLFLK
ncbi:MAG: threonine ammonia-lyase, biosynthetic [Pseudomonadota bacterium]|nr:threonine ammonia-lyase, biosynthetic [Pseudomonadota bacterium]